MNVVASEVECLEVPRSRLGEGPVWDEVAGRLLWVDILGRAMWSYRVADGATERTAFSEPVASVALRRDGGIVMAAERAFWITEPDSEQPLELVLVEAHDQRTRLNDGKCDRAGRFWAGSMRYDHHPGSGRLYRLEPDHRVTVVLRDVTTSNGMAWSPDDSVMYYVDSATQGVDAFEYDGRTGRIGSRRRLITIDPACGQPDGMTIDREGHLWVALWGGAAIRRYAPDGRHELTVPIPTRNVTSCTFGGEDYGDLFITTAGGDILGGERDPDPRAGKVFRFKPDVHGMPAERYAG